MNSRRILRLLQKSTNMPFKSSVPLSARKARRMPTPITKSLMRARMADACFSRIPYGRCSREALSKNITMHCAPQVTLDGAPRCRRGQGLVALLRTLSCDAGWESAVLSPLNKSNTKPTLQSNERYAASPFFVGYSHGYEQGKVQVVNIDRLAMLENTECQGGCCESVAFRALTPILHSKFNLVQHLVHGKRRDRFYQAITQWIALWNTRVPRT